MPHSHCYRRRRRNRKRNSHCHGHDLLERTFDSRVTPPPHHFPHEHLWPNDAENERELDGLRSRYCSGHTSVHLLNSVWRPVRQPSRESRKIFKNESRPPCPIHKRPASIGTMSYNTAILDEEIVIKPDPEPVSQPEPVPESASRHSIHSKQSKRSTSRHSHLSRKSFKEFEPKHISTPSPQYSRSICSVRTEDKRSSSSYSTGKSLSSAQGLNYYGRATSVYKILRNFADKYPRLSLFLGTLLFIYFFINQLDLTIAHIFESFVRMMYPASHYMAVTNEQFFARLSRMATRTDEVMEAFYCDFARTWCRRFELMCDVRCSFVEQTLQRIRKYPH